MLGIQSIVALVSALLSPQSVDPRAEPPPDFEIRPFDAVATDVDADGTVWALGATWKMRVGRDGATFFPKLGGRAPRHRPIVFGTPAIEVGDRPLELVAAIPMLEGDRARLDRGVVDEIYAFAPNSVEQSFVVEALPNRGEMRVRVPVATELTYRGRNHGLEFEMLDHGTLRYGDATILDAGGRRVDVAAQWRNDAIEIVVPESFVRAATLPIVVDPVISPDFDIVTTGTIEAVDVNYDATNDVWLIVYQEGATGSDPDILSQRLKGDGTKLEAVAVDISTDITTEPSVANNASNDQFLVVWTKEKNGVFDSTEIRGRTRNAGSTTQSSKFVISQGSDGEAEPSVGGRTSGGNYLVAWSENPALGLNGRNIACATVSTNGSVSSALKLSSTSGDESQPAVSKGLAGA